MKSSTILTMAFLCAACGSADGVLTDAALVDAAGMTDSAITGSDGGPDGAVAADAAALPCSPEGASQVVACGNCGMQSETCVSGSWEPQSACLGEGDCAIGSVETMALPLCGEEQRLCDATCHWTGWTTTVPSTGVCEPGDAYTDTASCPPNTSSVVTCDATCAWVPGPCVDGCGDTARTSPPDSVELCIAAGEFKRWNYPLDPTPYDVFISAFYIDRFPVTNRRYKDCVLAGFCTLPGTMWGALAVTDPVRDQYPVGDVTWQQAVDFCAWDGGRRLLTDHEWMKAARGPSPRTNIWTWEYVGMDTFRCDLYPIAHPPCMGVTFDSEIGDPIDGLPAVQSYYGVDELLGGGKEWCSDYYASLLDNAPAGLVDPQGPTMDTGERTYHGDWRDFDHSGFSEIAYRMGTVPTDGAHGAIRCGRSP